MGLVLGVVGLACGAAVVRGQEAPPGSMLERVEARIETTQVKVVVDRGRLRSQFQATVIARRDGELTLLTAAHCLAAEDADLAVRLGRGDETVVGRVVKVVRNPAFRPPPTTDIPGADNAVAVVRVDPGDKRAAAFVEGLHPAGVTEGPVPGPAGRAVTVVTIDQFGKTHVVRAGNFSNPRWLEWGPSFRPVGGDSGSGVFLVKRTPSGDPLPVLVGVLVDRSDRGGGAALVHRKSRWMERAFPPADAPDRDESLGR